MAGEIMSDGVIKSIYCNKSIYQSKPLIEACKQFDLNEGRLFYLGLMELKPQLSENNIQAEFEKIVIPTADVIKLFGGNAPYYMSRSLEVLSYTSMTICVHKDYFLSFINVCD